MTTFYLANAIFFGKKYFGDPPPQNKTKYAINCRKIINFTSILLVWKSF